MTILGLKPTLTCVGVHPTPLIEFIETHNKTEQFVMAEMAIAINVSVGRRG
jgi:hypothetical protein